MVVKEKQLKLKFTSFCNYSVLPSLNKVYYYYYFCGGGGGKNNKNCCGGGSGGRKVENEVDEE